MFGPRIPNVAKIKSEEPRIDVVRRTFDFVLPICTQQNRGDLFLSIGNFFCGGAASRGKEEKKERKRSYDDEANAMMNLIMVHTNTYNTRAFRGVVLLDVIIRLCCRQVQFSHHFLYPALTLPKSI